MKYALVVLTFILLSIVIVRPSIGTSLADEKSSAAVAAKGEKAKAETKAAAKAIEDYAFAQRAEFVTDMKSELAAIHGDLDGLAAKVERSRGTARADAKVKLDAAAAAWARAKKQLDRAETASEPTWNEVKGEFKSAYVDLKDSIDKARQWLSDKIAP